MSEGSFSLRAREFTSVPCGASIRMSWACMSSDASSSISVVSVPLDVTGEGPTKSVGLINPIGLEDIRADGGRRELTSVAGGEDLDALQ